MHHQPVCPCTATVRPPNLFIVELVHPEPSIYGQEIYKLDISVNVYASNPTEVTVLWLTTKINSISANVLLVREAHSSLYKSWMNVACSVWIFGWQTWMKVQLWMTILDGFLILNEKVWMKVGWKVGWKSHYLT